MGPLEETFSKERRMREESTKDPSTSGYREPITAQPRAVPIPESSSNWVVLLSCSDSVLALQYE